MKSTSQNQQPILLFDGVCNLCNTSVQFVIEHDPHAHFKLASLQSEAGQQLLAQFDLPSDDFDSFILIDNGQAYDRSSAALRVAKGLGGLWSLAYIFILIPKPVRDVVYRLIAKNRYRWFGKTEQCWVPTPELKGRFLG